MDQLSGGGPQGLGGKRRATLSFPAPNPAGTYRFELVDRNLGWNPYLVDAISFTTFDPQAPDLPVEVSATPSAPIPDPSRAGEEGCESLLSADAAEEPNDNVLEGTEIESLRIVSSEPPWRNLETIPVHSAFRVEVTYARPLEDGGVRGRVELTNPRTGEVVTVTADRTTGDSRVFLTAPIFLDAEEE